MIMGKVGFFGLILALIGVIIWTAFILHYIKYSFNLLFIGLLAIIFGILIIKEAWKIDEFLETVNP